jgi:hypothetical protein
MADTTMVAVDASARYFPSLELAQKVFGLEQSLKAGTDSSSARTEILAAIELDEMAPFYAKCCEKYGWTMDDSKFGAMKESNAKALEEIEAKLQEAITSAGDTEVLDAMFSKAQHFCKIGGWTDAVAAYDAILAKEKTRTGKKIDATMAQTRIALFDLVRPTLVSNEKYLLISRLFCLTPPLKCLPRHTNRTCQRRKSFLRALRDSWTRAATGTEKTDSRYTRLYISWLSETLARLANFCRVASPLSHASRYARTISSCSTPSSRLS